MRWRNRFVSRARTFVEAPNPEHNVSFVWEHCAESGIYVI